jgi:hypothetical protein
MTREALIKKVALKMDEISSSSDVIVSVGTDDNNPLYTQINGLLNEAVNDVLTKAPIYRITGFIDIAKTERPTADIIKDRKVLLLPVPDGFIRLVSISDKAFQRPITDLAVEGDQTYKRQRNGFLMGKSAKPVAVLGMGKDGKRVISCYSYSITDLADPVMVYIKRFEGDLDTSSNIDMDDYLADVVTWACAGKVFAAQGDVTKAKICDDNAIALMV